MEMSSHQAFDNETQSVLAGRNFNKIALVILSHLINQDFEIIDCNLPKYPDGGDACARYNGSKGMKDVMSQIGVTGKRFFLTPIHHTSMTKLPGGTPLCGPYLALVTPSQ